VGQRATLPRVTRPRDLLPRPAFSALLALLALALCVACDRNTEDFVDGEVARPPDLKRIFPDSAGAGGPGRPAMGGPAMPGAPMPGAPMGRGNAPAPVAAQVPAPAAAPAAASGATISGTIRLGDGLAGPSQGMLFVIARPFGVNAGPPLAVLRIPSPSFPVAFEIGPENVMIPSMRFEGNIGISVRLDGDGNAMTRNPGDLQGATAEPVQPGARDVEIVLDEKL
jgi:hypothetical protein